MFYLFHGIPSNGGTKKRYLSRVYKWGLLLGSMLLMHTLPAYANFDRTSRVDYSYTCSGGTGTLTIELLDSMQKILKNIYYINHAGYVYSKNFVRRPEYFGLAKEDNFFIPGCGCPDPITQTRAEYRAAVLLKNGFTNAQGSTMFPARSEELYLYYGWGVVLRDVVILEPVAGGGVPRNCEKRNCGNGAKEGNELCDPKDREKKGWGVNGCDAACKPIGESVYCGNGVKEANELCDPKDREKVGWGVDGCDSTCKPLGTTGTGVCGNGVKEANELCDPKDTSRVGWGVNGCDASCRPIGESVYCGNGVKEGSELCDPKDTLNKVGWGDRGCSDACTPLSEVKKCGDGVKEGSELCDPKDTSRAGWGANGCSVTCSPIGTGGLYCGDGGKNDQEECDPEDRNKLNWGKYGCDASCKAINTCTGTGCDLTLTGVTITEKRVCFQILGSDKKPIRGLDVTTTLTFGENTYKTRNIFGNNNEKLTYDEIQIVGDEYCIDTNISGPGGPSPGVYPVTLGVFCRSPLICAMTHPGGFLSVPKRCTGYLEVLLDGAWTRDGVMYDESQTYRVQLAGNECDMNGKMNISQGIRSIANGNLETADTMLSSTGTFYAKIARGGAIPNSPRGLSIGILYTSSDDAYRYGLTARDDDWSDTPLMITGSRMRGVRVIGNTSGVGTNEFNQNTQSAIVEVTALNLLHNKIRQNVAEITRGIAPNTMNQGVLSMKGNVNYRNLPNKTFQTLIVEGGDLTLDEDIRSMQGFIVLKNTEGIGGNVIVGESVKSISGVIFAEGMFRGMSTQSGTLNPDTQLILRGALYSRNTIGGSADPNNLFIYPNTPAKERGDEAFMQDLNNVRSGNKNNSRYLGKYSDPFIIDYDSSVVQNPLPGFAQ